MAIARQWVGGLLLAASAALAQPPGQPACSARSTAPFTWSGKNVLWLGTSIPHQGIRTRDSYPEVFCGLVGCRVVNNAFSGSHIRWEEDRANESCDSGRNAPKGLSATRRELRAKQEAALPDDGRDAYDESCSPAVRPLQMGFEDRINAPWARTRFDVVVIDHGHNDRPVRAGNREAILGTLNPPQLPVSAIEKGATTRVVVPGHGLAVHDDVTLRTPGIPRMDYWTGEILEVNGDTLTIGFDSAGVAGTYAGGGTLVRHDKSRFYDAYNLVISDILHMNAYHGGPPVLVILTTPPTEWTGGRNDGSVAAVNKALEQLAAKWGFPVYDMTGRLGITQANLRRLLPDTVHPNTPAARAAIAGDAAKWAEESRFVLDGCSNRWLPQTGPVPTR